MTTSEKNNGTFLNDIMMLSVVAVILFVVAQFI